MFDNEPPKSALPSNLFVRNLYDSFSSIDISGTIKDLSIQGEEETKQEPQGSQSSLVTIFSIVNTMLGTKTDLFEQRKLTHRSKLTFDQRRLSKKLTKQKKKKKRILSVGFTVGVLVFWIRRRNWCNYSGRNNRMVYCLLDCKEWNGLC